MIFWIFAIVLIALALVILLLPLLRAARGQQDDQRQQQNIQIAREKKQQLETQLAEGEIDQAGFDSAYLDLQTALALELDAGEQEDQKTRGKWMALVVMLLIPVASVALYMVFGEYRVIENPVLASAASPHPTTTAAAPQMSLEEMEIRIKERLRDNPDDAEGWFMLGRAMMTQNRYAEAVTAYQRSNDLMANEPGILFALADALAMKNNGNLLGEPEALVQQGLKLAPRFPNGLWLAGMAAEQREDYGSAHRYWTQLLPLIADDPESTREIKNMLHMLEQRDPELTTAAAPSAGAGSNIQVAVDISAELRARASPDAVVFVYAKAMQGPPMPLAVKKMQLRDLPASLALSDSDAMMPALKLSSFDQVIVGARVSFSGKPVAQSGDFFTEVGSISSANPPAEVALTIDQVK
jgi:cytochrome c-type biogenesis protein CcmH